MKVFKYIFKQKLLIVITIFLLLIESLCTFVTPFISSVAIDYGIQQNGIVYATPFDLDAYSYRFTELVVPDEDNMAFQRSYEKKLTDKQFFENDVDNCYYELNYYGLANIDKLEKALIPIMAYLYDHPDALSIVDHFGKANQSDITVAEVHELQDKIEQYEKNQNFGEMYKKAIDIKIAENDYLGYAKEWYQINFMIFISIVMVVVVLLYLISCIIGTYLASRISFTISRNLRKQQFEKVMSFSNHDMDKFSRASLITRATNDLQVVQNTSVFVIRAIMMAPVMLIIGIVMAYLTAPSLVWLIIVAIVAIIILAIFLIVVVLPKYKVIQKLVDKVNSVARESISGVSIIRALNNEKFQEDRFDEVNKKLYHTMLFATSILIIAMPILMLIVNVMSVSVLWAGSFQLQAGVVNIGQLIAFISYSTETIFALMFIAAGFVMLPRADVSIGRIEEVLNHKLKIDNFSKDSVVSSSKVNDKEYIKFNNVNFEYEETKHKIFKNLNFDIKKNSINAIVGPTGSGKSTLLKLLLRYYDVDSGEVSINGIDVRDFNENDLRATISYVPQKVILFKGTLDENVSLNKTFKHNPKRAEEALRLVNMGSFIDSNKEKMSYEVSQGARNLSGGQKQRISIARSVYEGAPIMLLDDPFSALDANTEKIINSSLRKDFKDTTILVVTQRLSSVVDYDNIIYIDEGKVVATGTHKQLLKTSKKYKEAFEKAKSPTIEDIK